MGLRELGECLEIALSWSRLHCRPNGLEHFRWVPHKKASDFPLSDFLRVKVGRAMVIGVEPQVQPRSSESVDLGHASSR